MPGIAGRGLGRVAAGLRTAVRVANHQQLRPHLVPVGRYSALHGDADRRVVDQAGRPKVPEGANVDVEAKLAVKPPWKPGCSCKPRASRGAHPHDERRGPQRPRSTGRAVVRLFHRRRRRPIPHVSRRGGSPAARDATRLACQPPDYTGKPAERLADFDGDILARAVRRPDWNCRPTSRWSRPRCGWNRA